MAGSRLSLRRWLLLCAFIAFTIFSAAVSAQGNNNDNNNNNPASSDNANSTPNNAPAPAPTNTNTNTGNNNDNQKTTDTGTGDSKNTGTGKPPALGSSTGGSTAVITPTGTDSGNSAPGTLPTITGTGDGSGPSKLTGLPTLSKTVNGAIPTYPPPSPPPTKNAPFMQRSSAPSGTVFIAVGAILGAFGATVLIWRAVVACLLHRSVKRAAMEQHAANDKAAFPQPPGPFYKYSDRESTTNLAAGGAAGRGVRRTHRGPTPSATPSQTNLFFSPTAPGAASSLGNMSATNRDSRYLPSGFYAASSASIAGNERGGGGGGGGGGNGHGQSISLSNLRPDSRGHVRAVAPSPPESPGVGPRTTPVPRNVSTSSVNLNRPPSGRAPSAYLDDLLDDHQINPGYPPFPPGPHHQYNHSQSTLGRYGDR